MSAAIFPFKFRRRGFREYLAFETAIDQLGGGREIAQKLKPGGVLVVSGTLVFPKAGLWTDFVEFWESRSGAFDAFLYQRQDPGYGATIDQPEVDTAGQQDFYATRRYVKTASLVVRVDGNAKVLGVDYSIQNETGGAYVLGTSTALRVHFTVAPGLGKVIELEYDFYYPVRFSGDDLPEDQDIIGAGIGSASVADRTLTVSMHETGPGYSMREAPTAL